MTVPLHGVIVDALGSPIPPQRLAITPRDFHVVLDENEVERLLKANGEDLYTRLELFDVLPDDWDSFDYWTEDYPHISDRPNSLAAESVHVRLAFLLGCQALICRKPLTPFQVLVDRFDGTHWQRETHLRAGSNAPGDVYAELPLDRVGTWSALVSGLADVDTQIMLALDFYRESVADSRHRHYDRAFLQAAIALEILLSGSHSEITHRVGQRAAFLVSSHPDRRPLVYKTIKDLYGARSKLVHAGARVTPDQCATLQQFLMAAIPRMAATRLPVSNARTALDDYGFGVPVPELTEVIDKEGWWSYCDFALLIQKPAPEEIRPEGEGVC